MVDHFQMADRVFGRVPGLAPLLGIALRILAVVDAVALGAALVYWIRTFPDHGGLFGAGITAWLLYRGAKRAYRAVFEFEDYRWMILRLAKWAGALLVIAGLFRASYWVLG